MAPPLKSFTVEYMEPGMPIRSMTVIATSHDNAAEDVRKRKPNATILQSFDNSTSETRNL